MIVRFPDTITVNIPLEYFAVLTNMAGSGSSPGWGFIAVSNYAGGQVFKFTSFSVQEQTKHDADIAAALFGGKTFLDLLSLAGLPTNTDTLATDMYVNGAATSGGAQTIVKGDYVLVTIGTSNAGGPTTPAGPAVPFQTTALVASFQPSCEIFLNTNVVAQTIYADATRLLFIAPAMAAGTYSMTYKDNRGSVTKANAVKY